MNTKTTTAPDSDAKTIHAASDALRVAPGQPTYDELREALSEALANWSTVDDLVIDLASCGPEGLTDKEQEKREQASQSCEKLQALLNRAY